MKTILNEESTNSTGPIASRKSIHSLLFASTDSLATQGLRSLPVGLVATICDMSVLYAATEFAHLPYLVAGALGFIIGVAVNYALSVQWVFARRAFNNRQLEFTVFTIIGLIGLGLTELIMYLGINLVKLHYIPAKIIAVIIVFAWNFGARRALLFRGKKPNMR